MIAPAQKIELALRAANLIKSVSKLIGVSDEVLASLMVNEMIGEFKELADFVAKLKQMATGK